MFEGDYSNGKRNGQGKEFITINLENEIIFEGEYLEGQRWKGDGKEYDNNEQIIYSGSYNNGRRWEGTETTYDESNELKRTVKYSNGIIMDGKGKEYDKNNKLIYEGNF